MKLRNISFSEIFDQFAIRIITDKVEAYSQYTSKSPLDLKDDFFKEVRKEVIDRFDFYGIYQDKMIDSEENKSHQNFDPK